ncbi:MAG: GNAT family N-acetyltransferase, partial [Candidatus Thorarchaeota archaeon]
MDVDNQFVVEPADAWDLYSNAWHSAMNHYYWYKDDPVFDFNKHEEIDEMFSDFDEPENLFLVARMQNQDEIVGVLGLRYRDLVARIRRWEPAVIPHFQETGIFTALLQHALSDLSSIGVKRISCLLKYPEDTPDIAENHLHLYDSFDFVRDRPDSIDMTLSLNEFQMNAEHPESVHIETGEDYTFEDLASITVKSFTSTAEEREIHGFDKTVTEHIQATALLQRMAEGFYGDSPDEFRKIAVADGVPAGFLGGFVSKSKYQPSTGILGPMAVLPAFRRRGIALYLVDELLKSMKEYGCEYAAVGTPAANYGA